MTEISYFMTTITSFVSILYSTLYIVFKMTISIIFNALFCINLSSKDHNIIIGVRVMLYNCLLICLKL